MIANFEKIKYTLFLILLLYHVFSLNITANLTYIQLNPPIISNYTYINATLILNQTNYPGIVDYTYLNASLINIQQNYPCVYNYTFVSSVFNRTDIGYVAKIVAIYSPLNNSYFDETNNTVYFYIKAINKLFLNGTFIVLNGKRIYLNLLNSYYSEHYGNYTWYSLYENYITFPEFKGFLPICAETIDGIYTCKYLNITVNLPTRIKILYPYNNSFFNTSLVNITCWANDTVPGLKEVRLHITNLLTGESFVYIKNLNYIGNIIITFNLNLSEGKYTYFCEAEDLSGKINKTETYYLTIDLTPPKITIYSPKNNTIYNTSRIWLNYTVKDTSPIMCWYILNGTINKTGNLAYVSFKFLNWKYRRKIEIYNPNNYDLKDFEGVIVFNSSLIYGKAKPDGSDIRFTYLNLTDLREYEIPFCFETSSGECINTTYIDGVSNITIWVKIPYIPANRKVVVYMYYGNPNAEPVNYTGEDVFDFYDDFNSWSGWVQYGSGIVSQDCATFGFCTLKKDTYCDPYGGYKEVGIVINYPFIFEARIYRSYLSGCDADRLGIIDDKGNGYGIYIDHSTSSFTLRFDKRSSYTPTSTYLTTLSLLLFKKWYRIKWYWNNGNMEFYVLNDNGDILTHKTVIDTSYSLFTRVYIFGGYTYFVDWIRIRKYADLIPIYKILNEDLIHTKCLNISLKLPDGKYNLTLYVKDIRS